MTNKLNELAKAAGLHPEWFIDNPEIEEFARLIIAECELVVADNFDVCEPWLSPGDLTNHFESDE